MQQKLFHKHYCSEGHQGIESWSDRNSVLDQFEDLDLPRKKELH